MARKHGLETKLDKVLAQNAPGLPESGRQTLIAWLPGIALVAGVMSLLTSWILFNWASAGDTFTGACNEYTVSGCGNWQASRFSVWVLLSVFVTAVQGLMFLGAYPALRLRRRLGWALMYRSALLNIVYAIVSILSSFAAMGRFLGALASSVIGLYFLFQIRALYAAKNPIAVPATKHNDKR